MNGATEPSIVPAPVDDFDDEDASEDLDARDFDDEEDDEDLEARDVEEEDDEEEDPEARDVDDEDEDESSDLERRASKKTTTKAPKPKAPKGAKAREDAKALKKATDEAERESLRLAEQRSELDRAMFNPAGADPQFARLSMSELSQRRAKVAAALEEAEARWMALAEKLEREAA